MYTIPTSNCSTADRYLADISGMSLPCSHSCSNFCVEYDRESSSMSMLLLLLLWWCWSSNSHSEFIFNKCQSALIKSTPSILPLLLGQRYTQLILVIATKTCTPLAIDVIYKLNLLLFVGFCLAQRQLPLEAVAHRFRPGPSNSGLVTGR